MTVANATFLSSRRRAASGEVLAAVLRVIAVDLSVSPRL
jgi:hypothetical protein